MVRRTFLKSLFGAALTPPTAAEATDTALREPLVLQRSPIAGFQYHDGESVGSHLSS